MPELKKAIFLLRGIYEKQSDKKAQFEIASFSEFDFEEYTEHFLTKRYLAYNVTIHTQHEIYIKYFSIIDDLTKILQKDISSIVSLPIGKIRILPDYDKLEIVESGIRPVFTKWEEINRSQSELIEQLKKTTNTFDIKNIGNTSRSILKDLAEIVFDKNIHDPHDNAIDNSNGKYKNQLHSYIKKELAGQSQAELRGFSEAAINLVEKAIVLTNALTHRNESEKKIAEVCVMGTIAVISIISFIEKR